MKNFLRVCLSTALIASGLTFAVVSHSESQVDAARTARASKFGVCHRTNAIKNPYRFITVAFSSVNDDGRGHDSSSHDGPVFNYANPTTSHGTVPRDSGLDKRPTGGADERGGSNNRWGDIFFAEKNAGQWNAKNWFLNDTNKNSGANDAGRLIYAGTALNNLTGKPACKRMSVAEYIRSEMEAQRDNPGLGITMASVMGELDEMEASDDYAVKKSLGGSFGTWYTANGNGSQDPSVINAAIAVEAPGVETLAPSSVAATSATLNGTVSPKGETMTYYFEFSTSSEFPDNNTTSETTKLTSASTSAVPLSFSQTGLSAGTTYYYRTAGVVTNGETDPDLLLETVFYGVTEQFNSGSPAAPTGVAATCASQSLTINFSASATAGVDRYEYSLDGGTWTTATLTSAVASATNSFSVASLLNGTEYSVRVRAFETTGSIAGFSSTSITATPCGLPTVITRPAISVQNTSATLNGIATSNGATTTVTFEHMPRGGAATCADVNFSIAVSVTVTSTLGGDAVDSLQTFSLTGLNAGTTYCYRIKGSNTPGSATGLAESFTTALVSQPLVTTTAATSVTSETATLNGTGTPNGAETTARFTYKAGSSDFSAGATTVVLTPTIGTGNSAVALSLNLTGLSAGTTYYFMASVSNANTSNAYIDGIILSFTTPVVLPVVTTTAATSVTSETATLNGTGTPNGAETTARFTYKAGSSDFSAGATTVVLTPTIGTGNSAVALSLNLTGLSAGTTYYFMASVSNANTSNAYIDGATLSFTTVEDVQNVSSAPASPPSSPATPSSSPTTTVNPPTNAAAAVTGALKGVVWIDQNRNGKQDFNEPGLPNTPIRAEVSAPPVASQSFNRTNRAETRVRKFAVNAVTDKDGFYEVPALDPGNWKITATLQTSALEKTFDSTNGATTNWLASAVVPVNGIGEADFAAAGNAQVALDVVPTVECTKTNTVEVQWAGMDTSMNTADDVVFLATVKNQESLVRGLPWGSYLITPLCSNGTRLAAQPLVITKTQAGSKTVSKMSVVLAPAASPLLKILPATGQASNRSSGALSVLLILAGLGVMLIPRRRRSDRMSSTLS